MSETREQPKLLGFAGHRIVPDAAGLGAAMRSELLTMKHLLGERMITLCSVEAGANLLFLKTCVELRIPAIVILPFPEDRFAEDFSDPEEWALSQRLSSVALAKYIAPGGLGAPEVYQLILRLMLEWADVLLFASSVSEPQDLAGMGEAVQDARHLGIPSRILDTTSLATRWEIPPDPHRKARHGFHTRAELLDFLDARFANGRIS